MKRTTGIVASVLLAGLSLGIGANAQKPTPKPTPYVKQKLTPKATMKGVGTQKVIKGSKNALRKTGGAVGKNGHRVKKSLSQNVRNLQRAVGGQNRKKEPNRP